jgi:penicillin-binding protein 1C
MAPSTLPDRMDDLWLENPVTIRVNPQTGLRLTPFCEVDNGSVRRIARWPLAAEPWLTPARKARSRIPAPDPSCGSETPNHSKNIHIVGLRPGAILHPPPGIPDLPTIELQALGGAGRLFWLLNGELIAEGTADRPLTHTFRQAGRFRLTAMDQAGNSDSVEFQVVGS